MPRALLGSAWAQARPMMHRKAAGFLISFATAKLSIYAIPLAVAVLAPPVIYGNLELAQSVGLVVALLSVGVPLSGLNQLYLVRGERRITDMIALMLFAGCGVALLASGAAFLAGLSAVPLLVVAFLGTAVLQTIASFVFRMLTLRNWAVWADGTAAILSGLVFGIALLLAGRPALDHITAGFLALALAGTVAGGIWLTAARSPGLMERLGQAARVGMPMMVVGVLAIWLTIEGRIVVGLVNASALAAYGVAFRVGGLALGVHQLVATAFFARLYASRTRRADRMISANLAAVGVVCFSIAVVGRFLPHFVSISALSSGGSQSFASILPLATLHTFFWSGYGMLQLRINRCGLAPRTIVPSMIVTLVGAGLILAIGTFVTNDVVLLSWLIALHAAIYFFKNVVILTRRGVPHTKSAIAGVAGGAILSVLALILNWPGS